MEPISQKSSFAVPVAIIVGFAMIAVAIYFSGAGKTTLKNADSPTTVAGVEQTTIRGIDDTDFIRGNPNAPIVIVEYSDYDCPFCQVFHQTMTQIMAEYGLTGKVAWAYRQFPISALHPNAPRISEAALCVGDLAGNDAFWKFSDVIFSSRDVNQPTDVTKLAEYAVTAGADKAKFTSCLDSGRMKEKVNASVMEAAAAGIEGTPHSILLVGNKQAVIEGAQPYAAVRQIIDSLIQQLDGTVPTKMATTTDEVE